MKDKASKKSPTKDEVSTENKEKNIEGVNTDNQDDDYVELSEENMELSVEERLVLIEQKAEANWDKYLRAVAELENVRKRASRDIENARKYALENFSRELL